MRIIGGKFRGRYIEIPKAIRIRPTQDKVREAIFNIIKIRIEGAVVLDLFAGSGSFGLEALSRGAEKVVFIDIKNGCINSIRKTLYSLGINNEKVFIIQADVFKSIKKLSDKKLRFDIIFLDPPYYSNMVKKSLILLNEYDILTPHSLIICEHFKKDDISHKVGKFRRVRQSRYGDTVLSFYKKEIRG